MNKDMLKITVIVFLLSLNLPAQSGETSEPHGPEKITQEQWSAINDYIYDHQLCLREEIVKSTQVSEDAREVSNHILEVCSPYLIDLKQKMVSWNIAPSFADQYIYTKKNKAANKMLKAVMMMLANKQATAAESTPEE